ncbi:DUF6268 family outer membrane beta-barrel protein [Bacteroides sp. OttesenSCG-928-E20]|nr:DUF6268 family outer membrane beta-barrel protein [Bacteroides sp. OttesenSCG-928-E20]MDL2305460.1 DUF6268 family outer membrane beta-barrel protein [Bacteroides sp. OttesenSCG-928-D19]
MKVQFLRLALVLFASTFASVLVAQGFFKTEYTSASSFKNDEGDNLGSGDLLKFSGRYSFPLSVKQNYQGQPILWAVTLSGSYAAMNNRDMLLDTNPGNILNVGLNLTHQRPLSEKWSLIATLGSGVYTAPKAISVKSILVNGGVIFVYRVANNLDLGVGVGLTNSFGIPIIMPMALISWRLSGKYAVNVDIANAFEVSVSTHLTNRFKIKLVGIEMTGMSSVMDTNGKSMIYSSTSMSSYLAPEWKVDKATTLYLGAGGTWLREVTVTRRTLKDFFDNMFSGDKPKLHFKPAGYLVAGVRLSF